MIPLFERYPLLKQNLPYLSLGKFPTPVEKLNPLGGSLEPNSIYVKRDDLSSNIYGGNKVRKLEFLFGEALRRGVREVLTFGYAGSNHALATTIYAQRFGFKSVSMLLAQPNAHYVRRNLLLNHAFGSELHHYRNLPALILGSLYQLLRHKLKHGQFPNVISAGGSSPLGTVGFVNAALELEEQIKNGELPEPDRIYVALGSMGTAVGLMLGLKAAQLKSQVIAVRVVDNKLANTRAMVRLFHKTNALLCSRDSSFPKFELPEKNIAIRHEFFGRQYALFTEPSMEAIACMERTQGIKLDGTYTGKAFAALLHDARNRDLADKKVLFWNSYNSRDLSEIVAQHDYRRLPRSFHRYFEEDVQVLDR